MRISRSVGVLNSRLFVEVVQNDITSEKTEAIVNAANEFLMHGSGVAGAIVRKGGLDVQRESRYWVLERGKVKTGECAFTTAGELEQRHVIHAVGPIWNDTEPKEKQVDLLHKAVFNALAMTEKLKCKSVSVPAISSGIYGFPKDLCAHTFFEAITHFSQSQFTVLEYIRLCNFDEETTQIFQKEFDKNFEKDANDSLSKAFEAIRL